MTEEISVRDTAVRTRLVLHYCVTYDFDSVEDGAVTVRDRDTMEQERIKIEDLKDYFAEKFNY